MISSAAMLTKVAKSTDVIDLAAKVLTAAGDNLSTSGLQQVPEWTSMAAAHGQVGGASKMYAFVKEHGDNVWSTRNANWQEGHATKAEAKLGHLVGTWATGGTLPSVEDVAKDVAGIKSLAQSAISDGFLERMSVPMPSIGSADAAADAVGTLLSSAAATLRKNAATGANGGLPSLSDVFAADGQAKAAAQIIEHWAGDAEWAPNARSVHRTIEDGVGQLNGFVAKRMGETSIFDTDTVAAHQRRFEAVAQSFDDAGPQLKPAVPVGDASGPGFE